MNPSDDQEPVTYDMDPCGECAKGKCDQCDSCKWYAEHVPSSGRATFFDGLRPAGVDREAEAMG